jgi:hypothetical protein
MSSFHTFGQTVFNIINDDRLTQNDKLQQIMESASQIRPEDYQAFQTHRSI